MAVLPGVTEGSMSDDMICNSQCRLCGRQMEITSLYYTHLLKLWDNSHFGIYIHNLKPQKMLFPPPSQKKDPWNVWESIDCCHLPWCYVGFGHEQLNRENHKAIDGEIYLQLHPNLLHHNLFDNTDFECCVSPICL